jgi:hypothetical protein
MSFNPLWFERYTDQKTILFDDFRGEIPIQQLLRLLDIYPTQVPIKGRSEWLRVDHIYITSNFHPRELYPGDKQLPALMRRITDLVHLTGEAGAEGDSPAGPYDPFLELALPECMT